MQNGRKRKISEAVVTPRLSRKRRFSEKNKPQAYSVINNVIRTKVVFYWMPGIACVKEPSNGKVKIRYASCIQGSHLNLNLNDISQDLPTTSLLLLYRQGQFKLCYKQDNYKILMVLHILIDIIFINEDSSYLTFLVMKWVVLVLILIILPLMVSILMKMILKLFHDRHMSWHNTFK